MHVVSFIDHHGECISYRYHSLENALKQVAFLHLCSFEPYHYFEE